MNWTWAAFMPHPPIIVPEVGQGREREAGPTLLGMERLCARVKELNAQNGDPDLLIVLSPHQPYVPGRLFLNTAPEPAGSLSRFGAPSVAFSLTTHKAALAVFSKELDKAGQRTASGNLTDITPDHASLVPLYFLTPTFTSGKIPPVILASPSGLSLAEAIRLGKILAAFSGARRWALLASGDLSHRLTPDAPAGYNPAGKIFDQAVVNAFKAGDIEALSGIPPEVTENAGECGYRSALILLSLCASPLEVFSYEGPFGVGYCTALGSGRSDGAARIAGQDNPARTCDAKEHPYVQLARKTIAARLSGAAPPTGQEIAALSPDPGIWALRKGCFVSIKNKDGSLRGCIGTFLPATSGLAQEIMANAVAAATRDPRFRPMRFGELADAVISVDVLNTPEDASLKTDLDPAKWGVIVSKQGRRGLLLPDLPGITTVEQQLAVVAQKAGITSLDGARIQRFSVSRYC